ncbi:hypothetical protein DSECCO2_532910 [anaerobic digester metagenome]
MQIGCADEFQCGIAKIKHIAVFHNAVRKIAVHEVFHVADRITCSNHGCIGSFVKKKFQRTAVVGLRVIEYDVFNFIQCSEFAELFLIHRPEFFLDRFNNRFLFCIDKI